MAKIIKDLQIKLITVEQALPIRHQVLWPSKSMEECRVEDDDKGHHFGVFVEEELVCVASVFIQGDRARLRKFATLEAHQGKGIGSEVLAYILRMLSEYSVRTFWCDARETAITIYEKIGMAVEGERFYKGDIPYRKMSMTLDSLV